MVKMQSTAMLQQEPDPAAQDAPKWEKVLWKRQPYPDNYTDHTFLENLVVNASMPTRRYWPLVLSSCAVTQQLCCAVAAGVVPYHLAAGRLGAGTLLGVCGGLLAAGFAACALLGGHLLGGSLARGVRQCVLLVGGVYGMSPVLRSLAATCSTDSLVALAVVGLLAHMGLCDYGFVDSVTDRLTGAVSLSCGVGAAVLLAGRMGTEGQAFAHVLFSLELFLLSPYARRHVRRTSRTAHVLLTCLMVGVAAALLAAASPEVAGAFLGAVVALTLAAPAALVRAHVFKAKISGPWDEAAPHIPTRLVRLPGRPSDADTREGGRGVDSKG